MNYQGVSCPVCNQPFHEGDDIVVCPECGAPHHRSCYKKIGHCALQDQLHSKGLIWENPNDKKPEESAPALTPDENGNVFCPNCGLSCRSDDNYCPTCRFPLKAPQPSAPHGRTVVENPFAQDPNAGDDINSIFGAIYENDQIDGIPVKDFIFLVRQNYAYYLRVFKIFSQRVKAKVFNWSAFLFNFFYFFYRKMYKVGALLLGFYLLSNIPSAILSYHMIQQAMADPMLLSSFNFDLSGLEWLTLTSQLLMYARFGVSIYCGFTANRHYYNHCRQKINKLNSVAPRGGAEYYQTLACIGGTSLASVFLLMAGLAAVLLITSIIITLML
mgnify:FL=1